MTPSSIIADSAQYQESYPVSGVSPLVYIYRLSLALKTSDLTSWSLGEVSFVLVLVE